MGQMSKNNILGIDLRVCSVKIVELNKDSSEANLVSWGMEEIPYDLLNKHPEKESAQSKAIQNIMCSNSIKTKEAVFVVSGNDVVVKTVSLPKNISATDLYETIKWKIKDDVSYPIEQISLDFTALPSKQNSATLEFLTVAANKEIINHVLEVASISNIKVLSIITVPFTLIELVEKTLLHDDTIGYVYMGRRTTNISFLKNGVLLFNREIQIGGEDITHAMTAALASESGTLQLSHEDAEKIKKEYGLPIDIENYPKLENAPAIQLQAVIRPALEKIESELSRTIEYFKNQEGEVSIKKFIITGGSSRTPHMLEFLSSKLGVPFEPFDIMTNIKINEKLQDKDKLTLALPQLSCAIGAALTEYKSTPNLLPQELREDFKNFFKKIFSPFKIITVFLIILLTLYALLIYFSFNLSNSLKEIQNKINILAPRITKLEELEKAMRQEAGRRGIFKSIEMSYVNIYTVLEDISSNVPGTILIDLISFNESNKEIHLKGIVFDYDTNAEEVLAKFILDLSKAKTFSRVELVEQVKIEGYKYNAFNFEIKGIIKQKK